MKIAVDDLRKVLEHVETHTSLEFVRIELTERNTLLIHGKDKRSVEFVITLNKEGTPYPTITVKERLS